MKNMKLDSLKETVFNKIFIKDTVKVMAVGTGKTYSCGHAILEQISKNKNDSILVISTMRNNLIDSLVLEFAKNLEKYSLESRCSQFENYINELRKLKDTSKLLSEMGILLMNSKNKLDSNMLSECKVILTNHAYFFPHGHSGRYNKNCYEINNYLAATNKKIHVIFDEFDQFYKFGISEIDLNFYVGNNFADVERSQRIVADHAFKYCRTFDLNVNQNNILEAGGLDFLYKLPTISHKHKLETNIDGITNFYTSIEGIYDFKSIYKNLVALTDVQSINQSKYAKKRRNYYFRIVNEISRYKYNGSIDENNPVHALLTVNDSIIIRTQKLDVFENDNNKQGKFIKRFNTPNEVLKWVSSSMSKEDWRKLYNTFGIEGKELFIDKLILSKKQFKFINQSSYYVTATPSILPDLGYKLDTSMQYVNKSDIKDIDIFVIHNKSNSVGDIKHFVRSLKNYDIETFAVLDKEDTLNKFVDENKYNKSFNHVNATIKDLSADIGRLASDTNRTKKNVTMTYQKGNETQGTNYKNHVLMLQDCHVKISSNERIISDMNNDIKILDYKEATLKHLIQSTGRVFRGGKKYKCLILFANFLEDGTEFEIIENLVEEIKRYGFNVNLHYVEKNITKLKDKKLIFNSILKHVESSHLGNNNYVFDLNNLYEKEDLRKNNKGISKYNEFEIFKYYLELKNELKEEYNRNIKDVEVIPILIKKYNISDRQFKRIKKKCKTLMNTEKYANSNIFDVLTATLEEMGTINKDNEEDLEIYKKIDYLKNKNDNDFIDKFSNFANNILYSAENKTFSPNQKIKYYSTSENFTKEYYELLEYLDNFDSEVIQ